MRTAVTDDEAWRDLIGQKFQVGPEVELVVMPIGEPSGLVASLSELPLIRALTEGTPSHLYHYTSAAGLIGICESRSVRATSSRFLNDLNEQFHALEVARRLVANRLRLLDSASTDEAKCLGAMLNAGALGDSYVFSLSTNGDSLPQWQAYGDYALGFPAKGLREVGERHGFRLGRCLYDPGEQEAFVQELISYHLTRLGEGVTIEAAATDFERSLWTYSPLLKHGSFSTEDEWRLFSEAKSPADREVRFRPGRVGLIPYFRLPLADESDAEIVLGGPTEPPFNLISGPTVSGADDQVVAAAFLRRYFGPRAMRGQSQSSYRR